MSFTYHRKPNNVPKIYFRSNFKKKKHTSSDFQHDYAHGLFTWFTVDCSQQYLMRACERGLNSSSFGFKCTGLGCISHSTVWKLEMLQTWSLDANSIPWCTSIYSEWGLEFVCFLLISSAFTVVPKINNVFSLETDGFISYIYGSKFQLRASERSAKKFKLKGTIDLWLHSKSKGNLRCLLFSCSLINRFSGRLKIQLTSRNF